MLSHDPIDRAVETWNRLITDQVRHPRWARVSVLHDGRSLRQVPLWPYTQVMHARSLVTFVTRATTAPSTASTARASMADLPPMLGRYSSGTAFTDRPRGQHRYVDDNAWVALAQWQHRRLLTPNVEPSRTAVELLGWLADRIDADGGAPWRDGGTSLHACSTGAAGVALALGRARGSRAHLTAQRCSRFLREVLLDDDGVVRDNIDTNGRIEDTRWVYNQGLLVRLETALHDLGDESAMSRADAALAAGAATFNGEALWRQPVAFTAIWFRAVMARAAREPHQAPMRAALADFDGYVARLVQHLDAHEGRIGPPDTIGRYEGGQSEVLDRAAAVQILALAALPMDQRSLIV